MSRARRRQRRPRGRSASSNGSRSASPPATCFFCSSIAARICPAGPETAAFGCQAPWAPTQKPHTKQIYCGKHEGCSAAPGGPGRRPASCRTARPAGSARRRAAAAGSRPAGRGRASPRSDADTHHATPVRRIGRPFEVPKSVNSDTRPRPTATHRSDLLGLGLEEEQLRLELHGARAARRRHLAIEQRDSSLVGCVEALRWR